jgi:hypothetical protein
MDRFILVPVTAARSRLPQEGRVSAHQVVAVNLKAFPGADLKAIEEIVRALLRERKHIPAGEEDRFQVGDSNTFVEQMNAAHATHFGVAAIGSALGTGENYLDLRRKPPPIPADTRQTYANPTFPRLSSSQ